MVCVNFVLEFYLCFYKVFNEKCFEEVFEYLRKLVKFLKVYDIVLLFGLVIKFVMRVRGFLIKFVFRLFYIMDGKEVEEKVRVFFLEVL